MKLFTEPGWLYVAYLELNFVRRQKSDTLRVVIVEPKEHHRYGIEYAYLT